MKRNTFRVDNIIENESNSEQTSSVFLNLELVCVINGEERIIKKRIGVPLDGTFVKEEPFTRVLIKYGMKHADENGRCKVNSLRGVIQFSKSREEKELDDETFLMAME